MSIATTCNDLFLKITTVKKQNKTKQNKKQLNPGANNLFFVSSVCKHDFSIEYLHPEYQYQLTNISLFKFAVCIQYGLYLTLMILGLIVLHTFNAIASRMARTTCYNHAGFTLFLLLYTL